MWNLDLEIKSSNSNEQQFQGLAFLHQWLFNRNDHRTILTTGSISSRQALGFFQESRYSILMHRRELDH